LHSVIVSEPLPPSGLRQQLLEGRQNPLASNVRSQHSSRIVNHAAHPAKAIHLPCACLISMPVNSISCQAIRNTRCLLLISAAQLYH